MEKVYEKKKKNSNNHFLPLPSSPANILATRFTLSFFQRENVRTFLLFLFFDASPQCQRRKARRRGNDRPSLFPREKLRERRSVYRNTGIQEGGDPRGEIFAAPFILIRDTRRIEEGRETSTRITRPRFLRNLREILYPKTNVLPREEGKGRTCVTCGQGNPLFDSWLEHLSREIYVLRGATLADGYKLITLVLRPVVQPRSLFFLLFFFLFFLSSPQTVSKMRALRGDDR